MTLTEFRECFEYNIEHNIKHAILGLGAPGVGKSQIIRQVGKKYGFKVIDIRLAQMSEVEIGGLIYPNESRTKTVWLAPDMLPNEERDGKNTILLLDEITSCTKRVQVAAYQLILDRRIGEYCLPEGCFVVALGNREDDDGVYVRLSGPLADRFEIHYIDSDFDSWKNDYALKFGVHRYVIEYLTQFPNSLHTQSTDGDSMVFATPRSWDRVSQILKYDSDVKNRIIANKIIGNVGLTEGTAFISFVIKNRHKMITVDSFLETGVAPENYNEKVQLISALVEKISYIAKIKSLNALSKNELKNLTDVVLSFFNIGYDELTISALKSFVELNKEIAAEIFLLADNVKINYFVEKNKDIIGF